MHFQGTYESCGQTKCELGQKDGDANCNSYHPNGEKSDQEKKKEQSNVGIRAIHG